MQDHLFAPPAEQWQPISRRWVGLRRVRMLIMLLCFCLVAVIAHLTARNYWLGPSIAGLGLLIALVQTALLGRHYRSWGYALRDQDLYITNGVLFRNLIAVPYGRMQAVEVESGPLERAFDLAHVSLLTASPESNAKIVGLRSEVAAQLRDQLTGLGESQASGL